MTYVCVFKGKKDNFGHNIPYYYHVFLQFYHSIILCFSMYYGKIVLFGLALCFLQLYAGNTFFFTFTMIIPCFFTFTMVIPCFVDVYYSSTIFILTIPILKLCFEDIVPWHYLP